MPASGMRKKYLPMPQAFFLLAFLALSLLSCDGTAPVGRRSTPFELHAQRWPEAETLFKRNKYWLGGDGAYSLVLGTGRVLWLFGDSFIGNGISRDRKNADIVRNTVAIQKGCDPSASTASFYWKTVNGKPAPFFPSQKPSWYWPGSGIRIEDRLLVFLMEVESSKNGLGFSLKGWDAVLVANPDEDPDRWSMTNLEVPGNRFGVIVGSACCLLRDGYLYAFGADTVDHGAFLVRWRLSDAVQGKMAGIEWWTGPGGWLSQDRLTCRPEPLFPEAQMEYTVHFEKAADRFFEIQTGSFFDHSLTYRSSRSLTGPWSGKIRFYRPRKTGARGLLIYAGKAHPGLAGADLVCTYAQSSLDQERLLTDNRLYYPVFVRADITMPEQ